MRVLVGCEYSGAVRNAFLAAGHDEAPQHHLRRDRPRHGGAVGRPAHLHHRRDPRMKIHDTTNVDLKTLSESLDAPLDIVTTATVDDARDMVARTVTDNHEIELFWQMLGIDDTGRAEGIERGLWTESGA